MASRLRVQSLFIVLLLTMAIVLTFLMINLTFSEAMVCRTNQNLAVAVEPGSVEDLYQRLVHVVAISDNHFREAQGMLSSVECCLPENKIIVYDLGLSQENRNKLSRHYNLELRQFPFSNYSHLPHVKNLLTYAWKPIIIKEVSLEYDVIMYGDSSLRMISCDIEKALKHLLHFPLLSAVPLRYRAVQFTHDGMIEYLRYPKSRRALAGLESLAGGAFLLWATPTMKEKLIEPWLDCALHQECIAPHGAIRRPCFPLTIFLDGHYIGCHRYDQSALNLILAREFGPNVLPRAMDRSLSNSLWIISRKKDRKYKYDEHGH